MSQPVPRRLFLDAGVVLDGCFGRWGTAKAVLVLTTLRAHYTVVLAEVIDREIRRSIVRRARTGHAADVDAALAAFLGWLRQVQLERCPAPPVAIIEAALPTILPALRHRNDLEGVVSALQARPDWVISSNDVHWGSDLAARTGLRIATPRAFLEYLSSLPDPNTTSRPA